MTKVKIHSGFYEISHRGRIFLVTRARRAWFVDACDREGITGGLPRCRRKRCDSRRRGASHRWVNEHTGVGRREWGQLMYEADSETI